MLQCTEDSHADKQWLIQATSLMTDVAAAVNEFKRRKDLGMLADLNLFYCNQILLLEFDLKNVSYNLRY